jgi:hypothetical protein
MKNDLTQYALNKKYYLLIMLFCLFQFSHAQTVSLNNIKEQQKTEVAKLLAKRYVEFRMDKNTDSLLANSNVPYQVNEKQIKTFADLKKIYLKAFSQATFKDFHLDSGKVIKVKKFKPNSLPDIYYVDQTYSYTGGEDGKSIITNQVIVIVQLSEPPKVIGVKERNERSTHK